MIEAINPMCGWVFCRVGGGHVSVGVGGGGPLVNRSLVDRWKEG